VHKEKKMKTYTKEDIQKMKANPKELVGTNGLMDCGDLTVGVRIKETRVRFGHIDLLVTPLTGTGEVWVEKHRVVPA